MKVILFTQDELEKLIEEATGRAFKTFKKESERDKPEKQFVTIKEAADLLRVSKQTIRNYISKGIIDSKKIGRKLLVNKQSIMKNLEKVKSIKYKR